MFPRKYTKQVVSDLDDPVALTAEGRVRGTFTGDGYIFRGIPYAVSERFGEPRPVAPWDGIRDAVVYPPVCSEISTMIPKDAFTVPHFWYPQSEACQALNLWTPGLDNKKRPVMVWIHGGGFEHGSCMEIYAYDGEELSRYGDVVVVNMNHRLHGLGYMDLSGYDPERYRLSGNLGQADLVECLRWIKRNIASFGGDPDNVMLFGQSGGGGKISTLMQMPVADGLFHKVCIESGISDRPGDESRERSLEYADRVVSHLGLTRDTIREIETVPFHKLAWAFTQAANEYQHDHGHRYFYGPVADSSYYVGHPAAVGFRPETKGIPMLIGNVLGEFENNVIDPRKYTDGHKNTWSEETLSMRLRLKFGEYAPAIRAAFERAYPGRNVADVVFTSCASRTGHVGYGRIRAKAGEKVYNWLLTLELPADGGSTPWHNAEEPFVFHQTEYLESTFIPGVTDVLQDKMASAWVAFARTGDPNNSLLPTWEPLTPDTTNTMVFDRECALRRDHDTELMRLMQAASFHDTGRDGPLRSYGGGPRVDA